MTKLLSSEEFWQLFVSFKHTAFRLETRDRYEEPEEAEAFRRFLAGEAADDTWFMDYRRAVEGWVAERKRVERVRVVTEPHSDYVRWSLQVARLGTEAGEDIRYLPRQRAAELGLPDEDYWLFDSHKAAFLRFAEGDRRVGIELISDPAVVVQCGRWRDTAWHYAVPFTEYAG
jgi:Family of unknown function (DUF6879)